MEENNKIKTLSVLGNGTENLEVESRKQGIPIIRSESAELLVSLVKQHNPKRILEFGTAVGFSGIKMLEACSKSKLVTIESDVLRANTALVNTNNIIIS